MPTFKGWLQSWLILKGLGKTGAHDCEAVLPKTLVQTFKFQLSNDNGTSCDSGNSRWSRIRCALRVTVKCSISIWTPAVHVDRCRARGNAGMPISIVLVSCLAIQCKRVPTTPMADA